MLYRCRTQKNVSYSRYGGRGITVCKRWQKYVNFLADMGERPDGMSLDRINNNRGYTPSNCRWSTPQEQAQNTRRTKWLVYGKQRKALSAWARELNKPWSTLQWRFNAGWTPHEILYGRN
jgi:hypothetical protein